MEAKFTVQLLAVLAAHCVGILRGHVAIIMKPSPPFPVCDLILVSGLLPIFLHGCEIKSGSDLGTRLSGRSSVNSGVAFPLSSF